LFQIVDTCFFATYSAESGLESSVDDALMLAGSCRTAPDKIVEFARQLASAFGS
jgi:hypothetical protein